MSANFALRLSDLRKEKNLSQKEAASCLGVSQALLSHYEKGIRECGLEFLRRACDYYDVTADYLLGLTDSRNGLHDIYDTDILPTDSELKIKTILRALVDITERLSAAGESSTDKLRDELLLSVYRFALLSVKYGVSEKEWFLLDTRDGDILASHVLDKMFAGKRQSEKSAQSAYTEIPEYLETVITHSEELLRTRYLKMLEPENE